MPVGEKLHSKELYQGSNPPHYFPGTNIDNPDVVEFFNAYGYLAIKQFFDQETISTAIHEINRLTSNHSISFEGVQYEQPPYTNSEDDLKVRKLMNFIDYSPHLAKMANQSAMVKLIGLLMEDCEPILFQDMAMLKAPGGREKPWHQDNAYFDVPVDTPVIGLWIALDHATEKNGCMHVLPGTHAEGPCEHFKRRDWQICDSKVQKQRDVAIPLPPGGCLLWHGLLHHGSPTNYSSNWRRALQFHYKPLQCSELSTEERMSHFGGELHGATC